MLFLMPNQQRQSIDGLPWYSSKIQREESNKVWLLEEVTFWRLLSILHAIHCEVNCCHMTLQFIQPNANRQFDSLLRSKRIQSKYSVQYKVTKCRTDSRHERQLIAMYKKEQQEHCQSITWGLDAGTISRNMRTCARSRTYTAPSYIPLCAEWHY